MPDPKQEFDRLYWEARARLPEQRHREQQLDWETFKNMTPAEHRAAQKEYNKLAAKSRKSGTKLEADDRGKTFVRFPPSRPLDRLPAQRVVGPIPPVPEPRVAVKLAKPGDEVARQHEALHVSAVRPNETGMLAAQRPAPPDLSRGDIPREWLAAERAYWEGQRRAEFEKLSERDRELWRIFKTLDNEKDIHKQHYAYDTDQTAKQDLLPLRERMLKVVNSVNGKGK